VALYIPTYPEAVVLKEIKVTSGGGYALYRSDATPDVILDYYKGRLPEDGWEVVGSVVRGGEWAIAVDRQGYQANVVISQEDGESRIEVMIASPD
jgi:hypothetical protein